MVAGPPEGHDGCMSTTSDHQGPDGPGPGHTDAATEQNPPPSGDPAAAPHRDLDRLRRSVSDRYIAGVAGGLGRHFDIDPTIVRVLLAVLTLFGGAGALVYAVCWCFVPEEGKDRAAINISSDARKILLLAAAGVAGLLAVGDAFSGFNAGWPIASIAVVIAVILIARDRKADRRAASSVDPSAYAEQYKAQYLAQYAAATPSAQQIADQVNQQVTERLEQQLGSAQSPPPWYPPVMTPPLVPSHPKRTGIVWFWPTLALIAIGLGVVGIIDGSNDVAVGVYPAIALAITGVMLLVGSMFGRPGGLIFLGLVSTVALSTATVLGTFHFDGRNLEENPTTAAAVLDGYTIHMGRIELDLTDVRDVAALAGRRIDLNLNAGEITVIVPRELNVQINADMGFAGGIKIPGYDGGGFEDSREKYLAGNPTSTLAPLELDIDVRVGQIEVEQR